MRFGLCFSIAFVQKLAFVAVLASPLFVELAFDLWLCRGGWHSLACLLTPVSGRATTVIAAAVTASRRGAWRGTRRSIAAA